MNEKKPVLYVTLSPPPGPLTHLPPTRRGHLQTTGSRGTRKKNRERGVDPEDRENI